MIDISVKTSVSGGSSSGKGMSSSDKKYVKDTVKSAVKEEVYKEVKKQADIARKRMNRLKNSGLYSPALKAMEGKNISVRKSDSINELRKKYRMITAFNNASTSTVTGARDYKRQVESTLGISNASPKMLSTIWGAINRAKEINPVIANYADIARRVINYVNASQEGMSGEDFEVDPEKVAEIALQYIEEIYESVENSLMESMTTLTKFK